MEDREWDSCADIYHSLIISPFQKQAKNPIYADIGRIGDKRKKIVADIGCGRGDLVPFLAERFRKVYAIDFSARMLAYAKKKCLNLKNVDIRKADIRRLSVLGLKLDVAVAANSILHPSLREVDLSLSQIFSSIRRGGIFIGIFPSMDSVLYYFTLIYERERDRHHSKKTAMRMAKRYSERKKYNVMKGIYDDDGEMQKFYYRAELENRLMRAGFRQVRIKKVVYPWGEESGDFDDFPGNLELWDHYVIARRP